MLTLFALENTATGNDYELDLLDLIAINETETTVPEAPTQTVTVKGLTNSNVQALTEVAESLPIAHLGKTIVTFDGTAAEATAAVQAAMDTAYAERGGRCFTYRSLIAVRNKLRKMA